MTTNILDQIARLGDAELVHEIQAIVRDERNATARLVAHLAVLDTREIHLREGYPSLFAYCRDALHLSEGEAYNRIEVARAVRRFPVILGLLEEGAVGLWTVRVLSRHLTPENHASVLQSVRGLHRGDVEKVIAALAPQPDAPTLLRKLPAGPTRLPEPTAPAAQLAPPPLPPGPCVVAPPTAERIAEPHPLPAQPRVVAALAPDRYRFQVTLSEATVEKLRLAKDLLRHAVPMGDEAALLDRALDALIAELTRQKAAASARPAPKRPAATSGSRHVPAAVRRAVWVRDGARCAYTSARGHRCNARAFLEYHHVEPYAIGGEPTTSNIQLRCRAHNAYEGRLDFPEATRCATSRTDAAPPRIRTSQLKRSRTQSTKGC